MPRITIAGETIDCEKGANLRKVLMEAKAPLYNGLSRLIHCRGLGTCGTCAVEIEGEVTDKTKVETWRLGFPPHRADSNLRLACQCKVLGDLNVKKHDGMWGQKLIDD